MTALKATRWDSAEYLQTEEDIAAYLDAVLGEDDPALVAHALGVIARVKGMSQIARETGFGRESLYKALCGGKPKVFHCFQGDQSSWSANLQPSAWIGLSTGSFRFVGRRLELFGRRP